MRVSMYDELAPLDRRLFTALQHVLSRRASPKIIRWYSAHYEPPEPKPRIWIDEWFREPREETVLPLTGDPPPWVKRKNHG